MSADFIDSNVFVYLFDEVDDRKRSQAESLVLTALKTGTATISFQVVQETLHVLTTKTAVPLSASDARRFLREFLVPFWRVMPSAALHEQALDVRERYQYRYYDALIIASAVQAGCTRLLSEDFQQGQRIGRLTIVNPFA